MQIAKKISSLVLFLILTGVVLAQDIHFSQFHETPLYRNPALAGIMKGDVRAQAVFRSQWNSIANAYKTASVNAEYKLPLMGDDFLTLGMQLFHDQAGTISLVTTHVLPVLNYHKSLSSDHNSYLSLGFMGGMVQRRLDRSKMTTNSDYEGLGTNENLANSQYTYWDGSAGISFNSSINDNPSNNILIGVAYHHFNKPKRTFYDNEMERVDAKWVYSADVQFELNEVSTLTIHTDHMRQGSFNQTTGGVLYGLRMGQDYENPDYTLSAGAFLRWNDAFIPTLKLGYNPFSFALSYDVNISKLKTSSYGRGGFELSVAYVGFLNRDNSSANALHCPVF